jgi:transposase-like protein
MAFLVDALKKNRKASYADLKAKADEKKLKLFPIMFGRAQAMLGIVKSAKRGTGKFAKANAAAKRGTAGSKATGSSKSDQVRALLATGMSAAEIAKKVGCSAPLVYIIKSSMGKAGKRGPGRPRKVATPGLDGLAGIIDAVKNTERERAQLRASLEKIQAVLADALA